MIYVIDNDSENIEFIKNCLHNSGLDVQSFDKGEDFLRHPVTEKVGCVMTALCLPGISSTEVQEALLLQKSNFTLIAFSGRTNISLAVQIMRRGAITILQKPFTAEELMSAIQEGLAQSQRRQANQDEYENVRQRLDLLSESERDVLRLLIKGLSHKAVSSMLELSMRSVDRRRQDLLQKMQVSTVPELVFLLSRTISEEELGPK